jgi:hypothetical protein
MGKVRLRLDEVVLWWWLEGRGCPELAKAGDGTTLLD